MPAPGQPHRELGEIADFAVDRDRAAVLLGYDLVTYRQPKSSTFAGRLGREKGLEQLLAGRRWNADAVITHPDLHAFPEIAGRDLEVRTKSGVRVLTLRPDEAAMSGAYRPGS